MEKILIVAMVAAATAVVGAPAKGPNEWDTENKGVTQITFEVPMPSDGDAHLAVTFQKEN